MKKTLCLFVLFFIITTAASVSAQVLDAPMWDESTELNPNDLKTYRDMVWETWKEDMTENETLLMETSEKTLEFGDVQMHYFIYAADGDKPENGYPLYIALHGGGNNQKNDSQWDAMKSYYLENLEVGMYVAPRGVRDTWDTHFNPESYPLYDRLIEYMILTEDVDPNRVYLEGFSAGGDGVYQIGARMSDRFAAVNMSSGHPNSVSMVNYYNLPIQLQAGENDTAFERNTETAKYGMLLDTLQEENEDGYVHRTLIHADSGHNYRDSSPDPLPVMAYPENWLIEGNRETEMVDSFPPDYMDQFVRDPLPQTVVWDLDTRAELRKTKAFYYLSAEQDATGIIKVQRDGNYVNIETNEDFSGDFQIMFNEDMIDFEQPVHFILPEGELDVMIHPEYEWLNFTTMDRCDPNYQFEAAVSYQWLVEQL